ncbi:hypothetical protein E1B28_010862 [Marasmius oreades]|uniref:Uncharacterized protein n=1 Tax=Marasmius oreades TaxID=181124 RepID=A0A9P7RSU9_9AGAR|nr:uncharacterized protein E1B28_010862 [Marasmius oreades]KAG7089156.1 hypothetical protein E1B28_010862 [Marasmius oreades]
MRVQLLLGSIVFFYLVGCSNGFKIQGFPTQATFNQEATAVFTIQSGDPTHFAIVATQSPFPLINLEEVNTIILVIGGRAEETGSAYATFSRGGGNPVTVAAWNLATPGSDISTIQSWQDWQKGWTKDGPQNLPFYVDPSPIFVAASFGMNASSSGPSTPHASDRSTLSTASPSLSTSSRSPSPSETQLGPSKAQPSTSETQAQPNPDATGSTTHTTRTRTIVGSVVGCVAAAFSVFAGWWLCRSKRRSSGTHAPKPLDGDFETVTPYTLSNQHPVSASQKAVPVNRLVQHQGGDGDMTVSEDRNMGQLNMDVYSTLDMISRDLADLRRMVQDSRRLEESLPDYSSQ